MPSLPSIGRIQVDPGKMGGAPCIRGLRIPVRTIVDMLEKGYTPSEILELYPDLEDLDIPAAQAYAREYL